MNDPQKEAREIAERHGIKAYGPPTETAKQEPCECRVRKALDGIVPMIQKRADELGELGEKSRTEEIRYRNYGACTGMHNLANEIGSLIVSPALADPCSCEQLREERDVAHANAAKWQQAGKEWVAELLATRTDKAFMERKGQEAAIELAASRSLLEEARLAMSELITSIRSMGPPWGLLPILNNAAPLFENADAVLAKIEASRTPEVTK